MRKIYLLLLMFLYGVNSLFAQGGGSQVLNEGFEGDVFPPQNWTQKMISGTINWSVIAEPDSDPVNNTASFTGYGNMDEMLITPQLFPTSDQNQVDFRIKSGLYNFAGMELKVLVSTEFTDVSDFTTELLSLKSGAAISDTGVVKEWVTHTLDLSDYIDQPVYLAFEAIGYTSSTFLIDDVTGVLLAEYDNDLQIQSVTLPEDNPFIMDSDEISVTTVIKNNGKNDLTDQVISFNIDGVAATTETISLAAGEEITITKTLAGTVGNRYVSVSTPADEFLANNEDGDYVMFYPEGALLESFEGDVFPPIYWTIEGDAKWMSSTAYVTHGEKNATCYTPDFKIITPKVNVVLGDSLCFDAYIYGNLEIATSVDGQTWEVIETKSVTGVYESLPYTIHFNDTVNTTLVGARYFSFQIVNGYGSVYLDKIYGPALMPVSDDFELTDFSLVSSDALFEGNDVAFSFTVKNNGLEANSKNIQLSINGSSISETINTGAVQPGEEAQVTYTWTADQAYTNAEFTAFIESDDYDGNNAGILSTVIYPSTAMELPYVTDFEDWATMPDYWSVTDTASTTWASATGILYSPSATARSGSAVLDFKAYNKKAKATLVTPNINMPDEYCKVSFWLYRDSYAYYGDSLDIMNTYIASQPVIDENASLLGSINRSTTQEPVVANEGWTYYEFWADCSALDQGFIIFEGLSTGTYRNIFVDDLKIEAASAIDVAVNTINLPVSFWGATSAKKDIEISVSNVGINEVTEATIQWSVDGVEQPDVAWSGSMVYNDTINITVATDYEFTTNATHTVEISLVLEGETLLDNNTQEVLVDVKEAYHLPYTMGFEADEASFEDWTSVDADGDGYNWVIATENATEGEQLIRSASFDDDNGVGLTPDNWLITPGVFVSSSATQLSFDIGTTDAEFFSEKYDVLVSESLDTASFVSVYSETFTKAEFKTVTIDLGEYKGKVLFIAFRHYDCTELWFLNLDNVVISTTNHIATFNVEGNSAPLANAQVTIAGTEEVLVTDAEGKAYADLADGTYTYTIIADGYPSEEGQLVVAGADVTVDVTMVATSISDQSLTSLTVYPNPFDNQINIKSDKEIQSVALYNAAGVELIKQNNATLQTTGLARGIYLLVVEFENGEKTVVKLTK